MLKRHLTDLHEKKRNRWTIVHNNNGYIEQTYRQNFTKQREIGNIFSKIRQGCPFSHLKFDIVLDLSL